MSTKQLTNPLEKWVNVSQRPTLFILNLTEPLEASAVSSVARLMKDRTFDELDVGLITNGGDGGAAYRIAMMLHRHLNPCGRLRGLIFSDCWSAGTLLALGMHELQGGDLTVLGPIDPQFIHHGVDGTTTSHSARDISAGIQALEEFSLQAFDDATALINHNGSLPTEQAAHFGIDFGSQMARAVLGTSTDIEALGGHERILTESHDYGLRLLSLSHPDWSEQQKDNLLNVLVNGFGSHDFALVYEEVAALGIDLSPFEPAQAAIALDLAAMAAEKIVITLIDPKEKASDG